MKTIYIDWKLLSVLRNPTLDSHIILKEFLDANTQSLRLVYSLAHLCEIGVKSFEDINNPNDDLKYLLGVTQNTNIVNLNDSKEVVLDEKNHFDSVDINYCDYDEEVVKTIENVRRVITFQYKDIRNKVIRKHFNAEPSDICRFSKEQMNELIKLMGISFSLDEFLRFGLLYNASQNNILNHIDFYCTAYSNLDLIGYYSDLPSNGKSIKEINTEALHSAYGSLCDGFITNDNQCYYKSRFLFDYYNSKSILIRTSKVKNTDNLIRKLSSILEPKRVIS